MRYGRALLFIPGNSPELGFWQGPVDQIWSRLELDRKIQGAELLQAINHILKENRVGFADLTSLGVMPGPASYTHLRIFVSTANTLAWAQGLPLFTIKPESRIPDDVPSLISTAKVNQVVKPIYPTELA